MMTAAAAAPPLRAAAPPGHAAPPATPGWRAVHDYQVESEVYDVASTGPGDTFTVGAHYNADGSPSKTPVLASRWNGSTWLALPQPPALKGLTPAQRGEVVAASSASNAWVFAAAYLASNPGNSHYTQAQRWNGTRWVSVSAFPAWVEILGAVTSGPADAWAFGQVISSPAVPYAAHWNGTTWARVPFPLFTAGVTVQIASAVSGKDIWVLGQEHRPGSTLPFVVEHYVNGWWRQLPIPPITVPKGTGYRASNILAESDTNVWATAFLATASGGVPPGIVLLHYNGRTWTHITVPDPVSIPFTLARDGSGGIWLSGGVITTLSTPYFYHFTSSGKLTSRVVIHDPGNQVVLETTTWIPGTRSVWSAGLAGPVHGAAHGVIYKYGP